MLTPAFSIEQDNEHLTIYIKVPLAKVGSFSLFYLVLYFYSHYDIPLFTKERSSWKCAYYAIYCLLKFKHANYADK